MIFIESRSTNSVTNSGQVCLDYQSQISMHNFIVDKEATAYCLLPIAYCL